MSRPYIVKVIIDEEAWDRADFRRTIAAELGEVSRLIFAEQERRRKRREAFWQDIGRPPDGHLGAVEGE